MPTSPPVKFVAQIHNAREVTLRAHADLRYWREHLHPLNLHPHAANGKAHIVISAVAARFKGLPFRELSLSVLISDTPAGDTHDGYYLCHAFNSSRFFALVERTCFHTPYYPGHLLVDPAAPAEFRLYDRDRTLFSAEMTDHPSRVPRQLPDESWEGPIFLPPRRPNTPSNRFFVARLSGPAHTWTFEPTYDRLKIAHLPDIPALDHLTFSHLTPTQWLIRDNATHAKSKTYRRRG